MTHKIYLIVILIMLSACSSPTIVKQITIGGNDKDEPAAMCLTKDGGYIVAGTSYSQKTGEKLEDNRGFIYCDYWIIKFDASGKMQWQKTIGGDNTDNARCIACTDDGGYIIAGASESDSSGDKKENCRGSADIWVVKIGGTGNIQWEKTIGGKGVEDCVQIKQTPEGGYIIGGISNSDISGEKTDNSHGDFDLWVIKINRIGNIEWNRTLGGNKFEFCGGMEITKDGVVICGVSASDSCADKPEKNRGTIGDAWGVKLDLKGNIQWSKVFGSKGDEMFTGICSTNDNGLLLSAFTTSDKGYEKSENSKGDKDIWIVKTDSKGNKIWDKTIGGLNDDGKPQCIKQTFDGGYIIGLSSTSGISGDKTDSCRGDFDFWVVKLNMNGEIEWNKTIGGNGYDELRGVEEIEKNHFIIAGISTSDKSGDKTDSSRGGADYWMVYLND